MPDDDTVVGVDPSAPERDPLLNTVLLDRYEVLERIGEGGMSVVYKVRHRLMNRVYAIKMLLPHLIVNPTNLKRFQQEARAASALAHPNVIAVHDFGVSPQGQPYLVMDYLEGVSLSDLIRQHGCLSADRSLGIFIQACDALAHAHDKGIVHRDLKPSNIMVISDKRGEDEVKLVDFGIAKLLPTEGEEIQRLTQTGEVFGSPFYMSPEQCTAQPLDARSDIYSMGCLMYETLVGKPPFVGVNFLETMFKHMNEIPLGLGSVQASRETREQLEAIVFKALAKDPAQRYQSMWELKDDLDRVRHGERRGWLTRIKSFWVVSRLRRVPARTRSRLVAVLAAIVLLLGATTAYMLVFLLKPSTQPPPISWYKEVKPAPEHDLAYARHEKVAELITRVISWQPNETLVTKLELLGEYYSKYHEWQKAASTFKEALNMRAQLNPDYKHDIAYLASSLRLANCYYELGRDADAKEYYRFAIPAMIDATYGDDMSQPCSNFADIYLRAGRLEEADKHYRKALSYWGHHEAGQQGSPESADGALTQSRFGDCLFQERKFAEAKDAYARALVLWNGLKGDEYKRNVALCHYRLGMICQHEGDLRSAETHFKTAASTLEEIYGPEHPYLFGILNSYADLLWKENRWIEAALTRARANAISAKTRKA